MCVCWLNYSLVKGKVYDYGHEISDPNVVLPGTVTLSRDSMESKMDSKNENSNVNVNPNENSNVNARMKPIIQLPSRPSAENSNVNANSNRNEIENIIMPLPMAQSRISADTTMESPAATQPIDVAITTSVEKTDTKSNETQDVDMGPSNKKSAKVKSSVEITMTKKRGASTNVQMKHGAEKKRSSKSKRGKKPSKSKPKGNDSSNDSGKSGTAQDKPALTPELLSALPQIELLEYNGTQKVFCINDAAKRSSPKYPLTFDSVTNHSQNFEHLTGMKCIFKIKGRYYFVLGGC